MHLITIETEDGSISELWFGGSQETNNRRKRSSASAPFPVSTSLKVSAMWKP